MTSPVVRPGARVLLLDDADRLLLFRGVSDAGDGFWFPPGGAVEPGEDAAAAAVREVREETGAEVVLGPEVWHRRHVVAWGGVTYDCRERWFVARVAAFEVDTSGFTDEEHEAGFVHRWWTLAELRAATERLVPAVLATALETLLREGPPAEPVDVGV
ncbi:MAG TPA: NUDIX domain-containing protein [Frankiaceae bacterium]|nr:NUDIX domain-containing protein [Frankiaceae bacterium]